MGKYPNSGIISRNQRKTQESHPDYSGSAEVEGVEYWVSGWKNPGKNGSDPFVKLSFKPKEPKQDEASSFPDDGDIDF